MKALNCHDPNSADCWSSPITPLAPESDPDQNHEFHKSSHPNQLKPTQIKVMIPTWNIHNHPFNIPIFKGWK